MARISLIVGVMVVALGAVTLSRAEPAASAAGQIAVIGCSQTYGAIEGGPQEWVSWEGSHDDFTRVAGQGGGAIPLWMDPDGNHWGLVNNSTDGNEVAVLWQLCIFNGANHSDSDFITVYDLIRDRWPTQPIYVIPLDVTNATCSLGGYDESVERQQWVIDNLAGTLPGPVLTPPLQAHESNDGCHPNQAGVDRYYDLWEIWVPVMKSGGTLNSGTFWDDDGSTHEGYIEAIAAAGITLGCDSGRFCPLDAVTRDQMASFIDRAFNLPSTSTDYFDDDDGSTHEAAINRVAAADITLGCDATGVNFCPGSIVTRSQMASFIDRAMELNATATDYFDDDDGINHEAAINRIAADGITQGCFAGDPRLFCPWDPVTRGQMASFLGRALDLAEIFP